MHRALASFALLFASGSAACSSSSGGGGVSQQVCALVSACGSSTPLAFGSVCQLLQAESSLGSTLFGTDQSLFASELSCVQGATDCASLEACLTVPASAAAACKGATHSICSGGYVVDCGVVRNGLTQGQNCDGASLVCAQDSEGAACGAASCDAAKTKPRCDGDNLITCREPGGALTSDSCKGSMSSSCSSGTGTGFTCETHVGETCGVVGGMATCVGTGAACDGTTFKNRCNGTTIQTCTGGKLASFDCTSVDSNTTCKVGTDGSAQCVGVGTQCTDKTPETCSKGVITYCVWGTTTMVDCKAYGLSGCQMLGGTNQTMTAACTP